MKILFIKYGADGEDLLTSVNRKNIEIIEYEKIDLDRDIDPKAIIVIGVGQRTKFKEIRKLLEEKDLVYNKNFFDGRRLTENFYKRVQRDKWINYEMENNPQMDEYHWVLRSKRIAEIIPQKTKSILDIGCGDQKLKNYIRKKIKYQGLDYCERYEGCIVADLNRDNLSKLSIHADTYVLAGVMEYIDDLRSFIGTLKKAKYIVFSYSPLDYNNNFKCVSRFPVFSNALLISEIIEEFKKNGFRLEHIETLPVDYNILCVMKRGRK